MLTHEAAAPGRERCAGLRGAFNHEGARSSGGRGNPVDRDTTEGVPIVARVVPQGAARWRSRPRGSTRGAHRKVSVEQASRRDWNRQAVPATATRGVRDWRRARQRLLQPTRRGRSVTRGAARCRPLKRCTWGYAVDAKATPRSSEPWTGRSKLACANSSAILPDSPNRANGRGPGRGRSRRTERCSDRVMCTHDDATPETGPRDRC